MFTPAPRRVLVLIGTAVPQKRRGYVERAAPSGISNFGDTRFRARTWKGGDSAMFWQPPPKRRDETRGCHRLCSARSASIDLQSAYASRSADGCRHRIAHLHEIARGLRFLGLKPKNGARAARSIATDPATGRARKTARATERLIADRIGPRGRRDPTRDPTSRHHRALSSSAGRSFQVFFW